MVRTRDLRALAEEVLAGTTPTPTNPADRAMFIDWATFWLNEPADEEWLIWPLVPVGRGVALYAPAKAGKSLVTLALVAGAATGARSLDGHQRPPVETLYLDYEMTIDDLRERLEDMGYGPHSDLSHLHYASIPDLPPLNTSEGAKQLTQIVQETGAQLVVVDTLARAVNGDENEPSTVQDFYRWTGLALKALRVAFLRVDHAGKDLGRGQRGHSSKNDDVDVVMQLTRVEGGVMLKATHRRLAWVPEQVAIRVDDENGWKFSLLDGDKYPDGTQELADLLDELNLPLDVSRRKAEQALKAAGQGRRTVAVLAALKWRVWSQPLFSGGLIVVPDSAGTTQNGPLGTINGNHNGQTPPDLPGTSAGTTGNHPSAVSGGGVPSIRRNHPTPDPQPPFETDEDVPF